MHTTLLPTFIGIGLTIFVYACQDEKVNYTGRDANQPSANTPEGAVNPEDDTDQEAEGSKNEQPEEKVVFNLTWDNSADPGISSYKIFLIPPDDGTRAAYRNIAGIPVEISNIPVSDLKIDGDKYTATISEEAILEAKGTAVIDPDQYCFSLVAVNGVGNSIHSTKFCMN